MLYLETGSNDPTWNLAFEEYCLTQLTQHSHILLLWQNHHSIIIGRYQNAESEINAQAVKELEVNVARRSTGGGAVYHDMGNLNYSFIFPAGDYEELDIKKIAVPMVKALQELDIPAEVQGRNDLVIQGQKISGTAQRLHKGRMLHHGTLLFDSDLEMLQRVLRVDASKYKSKGADSVRSRVTNIKTFLQTDISLSDFWDRLLEVFRRDGLEEGTLDKAARQEIERLQKEKYRSWDWIYGSAPELQYHNAQRFPGGKLEVMYNVVKGIIQNSSIRGDFLGLVAMEGLEGALNGLPFRREEVDKRLSELELPLYLGKITRQELLECMFQGAVESKRMVV